MRNLTLNLIRCSDNVMVVGVEYTIEKSDDDRRKGTTKVRRLSPLRLD
jgi:hypothetical protein